MTLRFAPTFGERCFARLQHSAGVCKT